MRTLLLLLAAAAACPAQTPDWSKVNAETLRHFTSLVQLDTTNPPGRESQAVEYLKKILDAEKIPNKVLALEKDRANLVARLPGNGSKRPLLVVGHTDTVRVDPAKWIHPPFSAFREGGYIYGRGTIDDKDNATATLMTALLLKRLNAPLQRDVIFLWEAGEEASTRVGIEYLVNNAWRDIDAEICLAEGGGVRRRAGQPYFAAVQTAEKIPYGLKLISRGPAGHGSVPLQTNALLHLSQAVTRVAEWQPPMRLNDTTRYYFERLATISTPEEAARYNGLLDPAQTAEIQRYFAANEPAHNSVLRTSISPNIIKGGYQINVIPSEAEATLDVRALPDEDMEAFTAQVKRIVNDPAVEVVRESRNTRPKAPPSSLQHEAFRALEAAHREEYNVPTLPVMSTGATDMAYLRARGMQCYGIGPMVDVEDAPRGFGAHSDQERILEEALYRFVRFNWRAITSLAAAK